MTSRKDYIAIAAALRSTPASFTTPKNHTFAKLVIEIAANNIAAYLTSDNPNFDAQRFHRAVKGK